MSSQPSNDVQSPQPPVGIDLGTTFSVLAYLDASGRPTTAPNSAGDLLTPSAVLFDDDGVVVGKEAYKNALFSPDGFAECFKRDMGQDFYRRPLRGQQAPPEVLSAFVLEKLRTDAAPRLGPVREAVITVPAFFDELRRSATQDAARLAGLDVIDIINEPTAAALAFAYHQGFVQPGDDAPTQKPRKVLVYDLGGGTFDVTILEIDGRTFRTLATDGDVCLGGKDFDERLVNYLSDKFLTAHGVDPRSDPQDALQLWRDAEEAKHTLSERTKTSVHCFHAGIRMRLDVTRSEFEELTRDLLERTRTTFALVVQQAGLKWDQIHRLLLVGGSSRMPMVCEMLRGLAGQEPDRSASPDEAVAHGAALYAGMLGRTQAGPDGSRCKLVNVNSHSLGVVGADRHTGRKVNVILIPKNTPLPHHAAKTFKTSKDNLHSIDVSVVEGESSQPEHCIALGKCVVRDLPEGLPKGTDVVVEFHYDASGRISVLGRVPRTRQSAQVNILRERPHRPEDLKYWRTRLCSGTGPASCLSFATAPADRSATGDEAKDPAAERTRLLQRLDALYTHLGQHAVQTQVPAELASCRQAALDAAKEWHAARAAVESAEKNQRAAAGRTESLRSMTEVSQARTAFKQAESKAGFALLVLGRECDRHSFYPPGSERTLREIQRLKPQLG